DVVTLGLLEVVEQFGGLEGVDAGQEAALAGGGRGVVVETAWVRQQFVERVAFAPAEALDYLQTPETVPIVWTGVERVEAALIQRLRDAGEDEALRPLATEGLHQFHLGVPGHHPARGVLLGGDDLLQLAALTIKQLLRGRCELLPLAGGQ